MTIIDQLNLSGKTALITGASKGIGKSIAQILGEQGANVIVSSRNLTSLEEVVTEFADKGITSKAIASKIGDLKSMQSLVNQTITEFGGIDILVNNAAANPVFGPIEETTGDIFDKIINVNVKGPFELAKMVRPSMLARGGSIINISSIGGITPEPMLGIYSVSKASLISLSKVMAKEWGKDKIRVNVICPGLIKTKFSEALWNNEKILNNVLRNQAIPEIGTPNDVAGLALFLASSVSSYCTGAVYTVDGGYTI